MSTKRQPSQGRKLRSSCDSCNLAKIKCSKTRPSCGRCEQQEIQCIYGVSMRAGKRRANVSNIQKPSPHSPLSRRSPSMKQANPSPQFAEKGNKQLMERPSWSDAGPTPSSAEPWSLDPAPEGEHSLPGSPLDLHDITIGLYRHCPQSSGAELFTLNQCSPRLDMTQDDMAGSRLPTRNQIYPSPSSGTCSEQPLAPRIAQQPHTAAASLLCVCNRKILQQLCALNQVPDAPTAFDSILNENNKVIVLCNNILNDQNHFLHHDFSFVMTLTALVAKVMDTYDAVNTFYRPYNHVNLSLYQGYGYRHDFSKRISNIDMMYTRDSGSTNTPYIAGSNDPTFDPSAPFQASSSYSSSASASSVAFSPADQMVSAHFPLNSHLMDEQEEAKFKSEVFKLELSKVGMLIKQIGLRFCNNGGSQVRQSEHESKAVESMVAYLQQRLKASLKSRRH